MYLVLSFSRSPSSFSMSCLVSFSILVFRYFMPFLLQRKLFLSWNLKQSGIPSLSLLSRVVVLLFGVYIHLTTSHSQFHHPAVLLHTHGLALFSHLPSSGGSKSRSLSESSAQPSRSFSSSFPRKVLPDSSDNLSFSLHRRRKKSASVLSPPSPSSSSSSSYSVSSPLSSGHPQSLSSSSFLKISHEKREKAGSSSFFQEPPDKRSRGGGLQSSRELSASSLLFFTFFKPTRLSLPRTSPVGIFSVSSSLPRASSLSRRKRALNPLLFSSSSSSPSLCQSPFRNKFPSADVSRVWKREACFEKLQKERHVSELTLSTRESHRHAEANEGEEEEEEEEGESRKKKKKKTFFFLGVARREKKPRYGDSFEPARREEEQEENERKIKEEKEDGVMFPREFPRFQRDGNEEEDEELEDHADLLKKKKEKEQRHFSSFLSDEGERFRRAQCGDERDLSLFLSNIRKEVEDAVFMKETENENGNENEDEEKKARNAMKKKKRECVVFDFGGRLVPYELAWKLQQILTRIQLYEVQKFEEEERKFFSSSPDGEEARQRKEALHFKTKEGKLFSRQREDSPRGLPCERSSTPSTARTVFPALASSTYDYAILVQHPGVYTLGQGGSAENICFKCRVKQLQMTEEEEERLSTLSGCWSFLEDVLKEIQQSDQKELLASPPRKEDRTLRHLRLQPHTPSSSSSSSSLRREAGQERRERETHGAEEEEEEGNPRNDTGEFGQEKEEEMDDQRGADSSSSCPSLSSLRDAEEEEDAPPIVWRVERGGQVTYHGPGQLVLYPILNLRYQQCDLHFYVSSLEQVVINTLDQLRRRRTFRSSPRPAGDSQECRTTRRESEQKREEEELQGALDSGRDLEAGQEREEREEGDGGVRVRGRPGVWLEGRKVCAVGVKVKKWVAQHGISLNVSTDLDAFKKIIACGLKDSTTGRIKEWILSRRLLEERPGEGCQPGRQLEGKRERESRERETPGDDEESNEKASPRTAEGPLSSILPEKEKKMEKDEEEEVAVLETVEGFSQNEKKTAKRQHGDDGGEAEKEKEEERGKKDLLEQLSANRSKGEERSMVVDDRALLRVVSRVLMTEFAKLFNLSLLVL